MWKWMAAVYDLWRENRKDLFFEIFFYIFFLICFQLFEVQSAHAVW